MTMRLGLIVLLTWLASAGHGASTVEVLAFDSEQQERRYKALIDEFFAERAARRHVNVNVAPLDKYVARFVANIVKEVDGRDTFGHHSERPLDALALQDVADDFFNPARAVILAGFDAFSVARDRG